MSGTRAWCASTTAGWSSAAAVPLVTQMMVGLPVAIASPRAKKAALRSSRRTWTRSRSARGRASGVEREPGQTTASVTPSRTHSSTRVALKVACTLTRRATPCRGARLRPAAGPAARLHADGAPLGPLRGHAGRVAHPGRGRPPRARRLRIGAGRPAGDGRPGGGRGAAADRRRAVRPARLLARCPGGAARGASAPICRCAASCSSASPQASRTRPSAARRRQSDERHGRRARGLRGRRGIHRRMAARAAVRAAGRGGRRAALRATPQQRGRPGFEPATVRDRHPGAAVGRLADAVLPRPGPGRDRTTRASPSHALRLARLVPHGVASLVPGGGHAVHLAQPEQAAPDRASLARRSRDRRAD